MEQIFVQSCYIKFTEMSESIDEKYNFLLNDSTEFRLRQG